MVLSEQRELYRQKQRYRYFAYLVVRDAIGFYFGIPKFLESFQVENILQQRWDVKRRQLEAKKGRELTEEESVRCKRSVERAVLNRIADLQEDWIFCKGVLFHDNIWLELLDIDESFFRPYLEKLPPDIKDALAVVPNWSTRDHSLGRPYTGKTGVSGFKFV